MRLAAFLGLQVQALDEAPARETTLDAPIHVAATCQSLEAFRKQPLARTWLSSSLAVPGSSLFITGITGSTECLRTLEELLPGVVRGVTPVDTRDQKYDVKRIASTGIRQFGGLAFGPVDVEADGVFALGENASATELVTIGRRPCFIKVERGGVACFLVSCARVLDIDAPAHHVDPIDRFLRFVPFLAYLRQTFGAFCWHNEWPAACLVIDDPVLKKRYGFLDFERLESRMARAHFSTNIAFIPWNWRRTDPAIAARFTRPGSRLSISIHGCDHTEAEFGVSGERWLTSQSRRALSRMALHERLTGIKHNRVMVFPQGAFSKASLNVIGREGFVAAVNSTVYPVDAAPAEILFRDLLEVAMVRFGGAPLFLRHYPDRLENLALDVLLGRPVLIVGHHALFKDGYDEAERLAAFVNGIAPGVAWTDLEDLCTSACLVREVPGDGPRMRTFGSVPRLVVSLHSEPDELAPKTKDRLKVFARRHLCEIRDNYLERNTYLSELARFGKHLLPRM